MCTQLAHAGPGLGTVRSPDQRLRPSAPLLRPEAPPRCCACSAAVGPSGRAGGGAAATTSGSAPVLRLRQHTFRPPRTGPAPCAASASEWTGRGDGGYYYSPAGDWTGVAGGGYVDPRTSPTAASGGPSRQQPAQPFGDSRGGSPSASYDRDGGAQEPDPLSDIARAAMEGVAAVLGFLVGRMADVAAGLLPPRVKRRALENAVKGGLALLGLALLQSVLSLVLTVGALALAVYTAHQVLGLQLPFVPSAYGMRDDDVIPNGSAGGGLGGGGARAGPYGGSATGQVDPRNAYGGGGGGGYRGNGPYGSQYQGGYGGAQPGYSYNAGQGGYGGGRGQAYSGGRPRGGNAGTGGWGAGPQQQQQQQQQRRADGGGSGGRQQGPVIDVSFYE